VTCPSRGKDKKLKASKERQKKGKKVAGFSIKKKKRARYPAYGGGGKKRKLGEKKVWRASGNRAKEVRPTNLNDGGAQTFAKGAEENVPMLLPLGLKQKALKKKKGEDKSETIRCPFERDPSAAKKKRRKTSAGGSSPCSKTNKREPVGSSRKENFA